MEAWGRHSPPSRRETTNTSTPDIEHSSFEATLLVMTSIMPPAFSPLGAYFRRLCSRVDKPKPVTAAAYKLARMIYMMPTKGQEYTDQGQAYYEERYRERVLRQLRLRANKLGMQLVATEQPA